jgi:hypothetical protein
MSNSSRYGSSGRDGYTTVETPQGAYIRYQQRKAPLQENIERTNQGDQDHFQYWLRRQGEVESFVEPDSDALTEPSVKQSSSRSSGIIPSPSQAHQTSLRISSRLQPQRPNSNRLGYSGRARVAHPAFAESDEPQDPSPLEYEPFVSDPAPSHGFRFYRISKALPFLLASQHQIAALQNIHQLQVQQNIIKFSVRRELRDQMGRIDKTFLATLMLALNSGAPNASLVYDYFRVRKAEVRLWKDVGTRAPEAIEISFRPYLHKVLDWQPFFGDSNVADNLAVSLPSQVDLDIPRCGLWRYESSSRAATGHPLLDPWC